MTVSRQPMRRWARIAVLGLAVLALGAQAAGLGRAQRNKLAQYQDAYVAAVRWSDFEAALDLVDPQVRERSPVSALELERYRQLQVSGYRERSTLVHDDGSVERRMELRVVNRNTMAERELSVSERWRWDAKAKRWWQAGGLPDLWQGQ